MTTPGEVGRKSSAGQDSTNDELAGRLDEGAATQGAVLNRSMALLEQHEPDGE